MIEAWLPVVGYEGLYEVSDLGQVRGVNRRDARGRRWRGRILRQGVRDGGHQLVYLRQGGRTRTLRVHRLVMEAFVGPCPDGREVCHNNGDPSDNRRANLRYDTRSANVLDAVRHGTHPMAIKTHCPRGHEYDAANTRFYRGWRFCRACARAESRARRARRRLELLKKEA